MRTSLTPLDVGRARLPFLDRFVFAFRQRSLDSPWSTIMVFLTPALLIYLAFTAYPVLRTFYNSVHIIRPRG